MSLLKQSIKEDGVTQPIVVFYDSDLDVYIVIDGFHRYSILKSGLGCDQIPVVIIEKGIKDRMASTIRHNRARGSHKTELMSALVKELLQLDWNDQDIITSLGMEYEEVLRLKQAIKIA